MAHAHRSAWISHNTGPWTEVRNRVIKGWSPVSQMFACKTANDHVVNLQKRPLLLRNDRCHPSKVQRDPLCCKQARPCVSHIPLDQVIKYSPDMTCGEVVSTRLRPALRVLTLASSEAHTLSRPYIHWPPRNPVSSVEREEV